MTLNSPFYGPGPTGDRVKTAVRGHGTLGGESDWHSSRPRRYEKNQFAASTISATRCLIRFFLSPTFSETLISLHTCASLR